ncbi:M56 family metallopeptidase [Nesterenkonia sp. HG001]|uniref:M56 family metallopeptidase n=1 Tax=Nesterenkonia sp. HG001 TaxID=2983207 RepID=UPI002AC41A9C|nr:M56 family metallopeptidase [Nesterenkonia sp. HG001]MDZ5078362.1 M56 family metallopeptidase [Nesterenkonia sp. HG001]
MTSLALFLAVLAFLLAVPIPRMLSRARFRARSPWTAMLLWQAIALAGGLALIGAPLVYGLSPFGESLHEAAAEVLRLLFAADFSALEDLHVLPLHVFALCLGVMLGAHLLLTLLRTYIRVLGSRRRHRDLVRLLSTPFDSSTPAQAGPSMSGAALDEAHVIDHDAPLAYCLPGRTNATSVTVLSRGLLEQLSRAELAAVVAHERTHLQQRHHLLTMAFDAWYRALPWLPTTRYGREAVLELTEMLADDGALQEHSREDLLRSLALSTPDAASTEAAAAPEGAAAPPVDAARGATAGASGAVITTARLRRLLIPPPALPRAAQIVVVATAAALLTVPTALLLIL